MEAALLSHAGVSQAVVSAVDMQDGVKHLVGYVTPLTPDRTGVASLPIDNLSATDLRKHLRQWLPDYMIPTVFVLLDALPLTASGKVNRLALPAARGMSDAGPYTEPCTEVERVLASIWRGLLGIDRAGLDDNFFERGGHSLLAAQLVNQARELLAIDLKLTDVFVAPTLRELAQRAEQHQRGSSGARLPPLLPMPRTDLVPASYMQRRLWFLEQMDLLGSAYNVPVTLRLEGALDVPALERALSELVRRHESLRTRFVARGGEPLQVIDPSSAIALPVFDLSGLEGAQRDLECAGLTRAAIVRRFDLRAGPLLHASLLRLSDSDHVLLLTLHHIIFDGWSQTILFRELGTLYRAFSQGQASPLPELAVQYADYVLWQREWLSGQVLEEQLSYWKNRLSGAAGSLNLPADRPRPAVASFNGDTLDFVLSDELCVSLVNLGRRAGATLHMVLLAAFQVLLSRWSGQKDIAVGFPIAGRTHRETEGLIGFFVNALVVRSDLSDDPTFDALLGQVKKMTLEAYAHQDVPFEKVVETIQPERDLSRQPIYQVAFAFQNLPRERLEMPGLGVKAAAMPHVTAKLDLSLYMQQTQSCLLGSFEFATDLFDRSTIERIAGHFDTLLKQIVVAPHQAVTRFSLLEATQRHRLLIELNETATDYPREKCLHELFAAQAVQMPDALAVSCANEALSYAQVERRSNQLAGYLQTLGVGPEVVVGLHLGRSLQMAIGLLGILKAGGACLPLDPDCPLERLTFMLEDSGARLLLTTQALDRKPPPLHKAGVVCVEQDRELIAAQPIVMPRSGVSPESLAYVIYTSGSTGRPKGVMLRHAGLCNLAAAQAREFEVRSESRVLQFARLGFDASISEIFMAWYAGAQLCLMPDSRAASTELPLILTDLRITTATLPPAALTLLERGEFPALQTLVVAGEACPPEIGSYWASRYRFINAYGPTEASVCASCGRWQGKGSVVPIGRALSNICLYVLDEELEPVPIGMIGELYIGGLGLARGYLNRPGLTAERFIANPYGTGNRLYRSGDRARYREEGALEFVGRNDRQVKIRGHRVELAEIEAALIAHPGVSTAIVVVREDEPGDKRLIGYVAAERRSAGEDASQEYIRLRGELVDQWSRLFDETCQSGEPEHGPDFTGWVSSYTGEALPREQMQEWLDNTVTRIASLEPRRVLEIGCGTGLLLQRLAPRCATYQGTDISRQTLAALQKRIDRAEELRHVRLTWGEADSLEEFESASFDTAILNSVIQYFPDGGYLLGVLECLVGLIGRPGRIFVGDIRHPKLLPALYGSIHLAKAADRDTVGHLHQQILRSERQEQELAVDPDLFRTLLGHISGIGAVEILLKRGAADNELTKYRYDAILHVGEHLQISESACECREWVPGRSSLEELAAWLHSSRPPAVRVRNVPNRRVAWDLAAYQRIVKSDTKKRVAQLRSELNGLEAGGEEPEAFYALGEQEGYETRLCWAAAADCFDVHYLARGAAIEPSSVFDVGTTRELGFWREYVNDPLIPVRLQQLSEHLREHTRRLLPDYMMPSRIVVLDALPLTENGKIDHRELSRRESHSELGKYVGPRTQMERSLTAIWRELLRLERVGIHDNFFELGGHSLMATRVTARVRDVFNVELPLRTLFETPTIVGLGLRLENLRPERGDFVLPPLTKGSRPERLPASYGQRRLWFVEQLHLAGAAYNMPMALRLEGELDVEALELGLAEVIRRHESLRTRFDVREGEVVQMIDEPGDFHLSLSDFSALRAQERQQEIRHRIQQEVEHRFDLQADPLFRAALLRLAEHEHVLLLTTHHIVSDGWSQGILIQELGTLYRAFSQALPSPLPEMPLQYADYALWQRSWLQGEILARQLEYWLGRLAGAPESLALPTDRPRPAVASFRGGTVPFALSSELTRGLQESAQRNGVTLYMVLLAAFQVLLSRWSGQKDILVGTPVAGRTHRQIEGLIGFFVNTLVMRSDLTANPTFEELLTQVKETTLGAYTHQDLPFERLVEQLNPIRDLSRQPIFQVLFSLQNMPAEALDLPGLRLRSLGGEHITAKFDLALDMGEARSSLHGAFEYSADLFERQTIERLAEYFGSVLEGIVADAQRRCGDMPLLSEAQRHQLLVEWNATQTEYPRQSTLADLFAEQAARTPEAVAVVYEGQEIRYGELDRRANQLAHYLRALGVGPDVIVGVCLERSVELVIGLLGILKAGGAYLPLDPDYPPERLAFMLQDAGAAVVLTQGAVLERGTLAAVMGAGSRSWVCVDREWERIAREPVTAPAGGAQPENLAYVIYTSGSTGVPKGVMTAHAAIVNRLSWMDAAYGLKGEERVLQKTPFSFDVSVWELFWPLLKGAALVVARPEGHKDAEYLREVIETQAISIIHFVPSMLQEFVSTSGLSRCGSLREVICSGEALTPAVAEAFFGKLPARLHNLYGPTEAAVDVSFWECRPGAEVVPIGRPIANTRLYVLDEELEPVPVGVVGELYIGGAGLARGYLNRAGLTAERFIAHPFVEASAAGGGRAVVPDGRPGSVSLGRESGVHRAS